MGSLRPKQPIHLPNSADPDPDEAIRRDWAEANLSGGGGSSTLSELLVGSGSTLTLVAGDQLMRYGRGVVEGTLIIDGLVVVF